MTYACCPKAGKTSGPAIKQKKAKTWLSYDGIFNFKKKIAILDKKTFLLPKVMVLSSMSLCVDKLSRKDKKIAEMVVVFIGNTTLRNMVHLSYQN